MFVINQEPPCVPSFWGKAPVVYNERKLLYKIYIISGLHREDFHAHLLNSATSQEKSVFEKSVVTKSLATKTEAKKAAHVNILVDETKRPSTTRNTAKAHVTQFGSQFHISRV